MIWSLMSGSSDVLRYKANKKIPCSRWITKRESPFEVNQEQSFILILESELVSFIVILWVIFYYSITWTTGEPPVGLTLWVWIPVLARLLRSTLSRKLTLWFSLSHASRRLNAFTIWAFSRQFYPKRLTMVHTRKLTHRRRSLPHRVIASSSGAVRVRRLAQGHLNTRSTSCATK